MELLFFKPQSKLLGQYIEYFYILRKPEQSDNLCYYTFPQVNAIVSINQNPKFIFGENKLTVARNRRLPILSTLICSYNKPIEVVIPGYINEITISFKPLGLNAFLDQNLDTYTSNSFSYFDPYPDFKVEMTKIIALNNAEDKIKRLENYLLSKHLGFSHPFLHDVMNDMLHSNRSYTVKEIANKYKISRKTLYKHFEMHVGKNPTEMRKVIRFRQVIQEQIKFKKKNKFCDITYKLDFFDQSHLIKDFKSITGFTPKEFFNKMSPMNDGCVNWLFL
jgi:AraC-like DNA-binding protein